ncbi:helix-turn-helix transcriptional regulator [Gordonia insulae]|uniref:HTH-type transcriptional regulator NimR n=1 Tax=Gordonia insulae TaxID=2420509 RepID=A0A3G8JIY7_9ACTN|nr:AraC family transcriptional regulator [Gordonia insulae]AZG45047.1 HTH-type transcriptional regulator NimR [Gordonia insulae]
MTPTSRVDGDVPWIARLPDTAGIPPTTVTNRLHPSSHALHWQVCGHTDFDVDAGTVTLPSDHAIWIPAGTRHTMTISADSVVVPTFFDSSITSSLRSADVIAVDFHFRALVLALVGAAYAPHLAPETELRRQLLSVIEQAAPTGALSLTMPNDGPARVVAEALRTNPADGRTIDEWARHTHSSARTIERAFRLQTGGTFQQWRTHCRMETAKALLSRAQSVAAVSHRVGYHSQSSFARAFRAHFGRPPGEFIID